MNGVRALRLWVVGGVLGAIVLLAAGWVLLVSPQYADTDRLHDEASTTDRQVASLRRQLLQLRQDNGKLQQYREQLARDRQALPTASGLSDFLRELQAGAGVGGVAVDSLVVGPPARAPIAAEVYVLPITVIATGNAPKLWEFVRQLQQVQPRAVFINSANAVPDGRSRSLAGSVTLTVSMQVFVAGTGGTAAPERAQPSGGGTGSGAGAQPAGAGQPGGDGEERPG